MSAAPRTVRRAGRRTLLGAGLVGALAAALVGWSLWSGSIDDAVAAASTAPAAAGVDEVVLGDDVFAPVAVAVPVGTSVTWRWTGEEHDVVLDDGRRSPVQADGTWTARFDTQGTVAYRCSLHPRMHGRVDVDG